MLIPTHAFAAMAHQNYDADIRYAPDFTHMARLMDNTTWTKAMLVDVSAAAQKIDLKPVWRGRNEDPILTYNGKGANPMRLHHPTIFDFLQGIEAQSNMTLYRWMVHAGDPRYHEEQSGFYHLDGRYSPQGVNVVINLKGAGMDYLVGMPFSRDDEPVHHMTTRLYAEDDAAFLKACGAFRESVQVGQALAFATVECGKTLWHKPPKSTDRITVIARFMP